MLRANIHFMCL